MTSRTTNKFSPEVRSRAVRLVLDHEHEHSSRWAAIESVAAKIGCSAQTLNEWIKKVEVDSGKRPGMPTDVAGRLKALERENRELETSGNWRGSAFHDPLLRSLGGGMPCRGSAVSGTSRIG